MAQETNNKTTELTESKGKGGEIQSIDMSKYTDMGLKGIEAEDIRPPVMFLVQGNIDKTELVDAKTGKECPDGKFFLKGTNEVIDQMDVYFIMIKKDTYKKEGSDWDDSTMYRAIMVRKTDLMPIAINFSKTSTWAISDLLTSIKLQQKPAFMFNVIVRSTQATSKDGKAYYKIALSVGELEQDRDRLRILFDLAKQFDSQSDEAFSNTGEAKEELREKVNSIRGSKPAGDDVNPDDVPF